MTDYTIPDPSTVPANGYSDWMNAKLADALVRDEAIAALVALAQGHHNLTVSVSLATATGEREDYTCDKCREYHPAGLNVALTAFGRDTDTASTTILNPMDLFEWAAVVVQVGLCHTCWAQEGYAPVPGAAEDPGFVQQAVRLMEAPDLLTLLDWEK